MGKFIKSLMIILAITFILDRAGAYIVAKFYKTTTTTDEYKLNFVTFRMEEPVIFMGSSRAHHHYIPAIISDSLKKGVYNAGLWGMRNIYFQYGLLSNILERYTPEIICLEVHPVDYLQTPFSTTASAGNLSPFINLSAGCDEVLKNAGVYEKAEISHLYRYNSQFANILAGNLSERTSPADKGYKSLSGLLDTTHAHLKAEQFPYPADENKIRYLQAFIDRCKARKIKLILLYSPMYAVEKNTLFELPKQIARKNQIPFLNFYYLEGLSKHPEYYYDFGHLNDAGARRYSAAISHELKKLN